MWPVHSVVDEIDQTNKVYATVRETFRILGFDQDNIGTPAWNALSWSINAGETVLLKPNMIAHNHNDDWDYVITHGSVIRAVIDYVYLAHRGTGKIITGDACQTDSDFENIVQSMGLHDIQKWYMDRSDFEIQIIDLKLERWIEKNEVY